LFCNGKYINVDKCLSQVAPYERPALSKGYLLPEGMNHSTTGYFEWLVDKITLFDQSNSFMLFILYNEQSNSLIWNWVELNFALWLYGHLNFIDL
jgi:hypothetical protein